VNRSSAIIGLLIICRLVVSGQTGKTTSFIKVAQFKIARITLGSAVPAAERVFGKPDSIEDNSAMTDSVQEQTYYFKGVTMRFCGGKACELQCVNPRYKTPQGLKVGDTVAKLFKTLGKTEIWQENGLRKAHYLLWPPSDTYMIFEFQHDRISKIILEFSP